MDVDNLFIEMIPYKGMCKYQDCLHINETDCAIKSHLGEIDESRYESYVAFVEEAKEYKEKVLPKNVTKRLYVEMSEGSYLYKYVGLDGAVYGIHHHCKCLSGNQSRCWSADF